MIITRAPFRVSFVGGGSDIKSYYEKSCGAVLSTTIDKYMYIMIHPYFHNKIRIKYSKLEDVDDVEQIQHPIFRECLRQMRVEKGVEITSVADVPAGTGLGSSSAFTVCLLHALYTYKGKSVTKERLAKEASRIEIDILNEPIGKQDHYASSFGNLNYIRFNRDESVHVEPIVCNPGIKKRLEKNLLMFYLGHERSSSLILNEQRENINKPDKTGAMQELVQLAKTMKQAVENGRLNRFGEILHEGWLIKKKLARSISSPMFDDYYDNALKAGALGGKILGAGGGGFFLFYCQPKYQDAVRKALNLRELSFRFDIEGTRIIYLDR